MGLLEDQYFGVVVKGEGFFSRLVINDQAAKCGVGFKNPYQRKTQPAFILPHLRCLIAFDNICPQRAAEQFTVIISGERVALWNARDLRILMIGGDDDVICCVENLKKAVQFFGVVVPINLQGQVAAINSAKGIVAVYAEGQTPVVVGFVGKRRAAHHQAAAEGFNLQIINLPFHQRNRLIKGKRYLRSAHIAGGLKINQLRCARQWNFRRKGRIKSHHNAGGCAGCFHCVSQDHLRDPPAFFGRKGEHEGRLG